MQNLLSDESSIDDILGDAGLAVMPLVEWLVDVMEPRRILTVGPLLESVHLKLCDVVSQQENTVQCIHVAEVFSEPFLAEARQFSLTQSQLVMPDITKVRLGVEGQFDVVLMTHSAFNVSNDTVSEWRAGLTPSGAALIYSREANKEEIDQDGYGFTFGVSDETMSLFWNKYAAEELQDLENVDGVGSSRLVTDLAHRVTQLKLKALSNQSSAMAYQVEELRQENHQSLLTLTRKLAEQEERLLQANDVHRKLKAIESSTIWTKTEFIRRFLNNRRRLRAK